MQDEGFPRDLLQRPIQDRVAYFNAYTMAHPKLVEAAQQLTDYVKEPVEAPLIFLFGATGVGKSTLLRRVSQKLTEAMLPELEVDRGRIPVAGIEAMAPEFSNFDWKDFYLRTLQALQEPIISATAVNYGSGNKFKLRTAVESALRHRQPSIFFIDEAQNLGMVSSGRKLRDQADCIKSLANLCSVQFALVGTYDLLLLRNLSAQLCRRSVDIHFSRYQAESVQDLKVFRNIVQTFQYHLPLKEQPNFIEHWDFCYERSIGCVGILKDWLSRTLAIVLARNEDAITLTVKDLEEFAPSLEKCMSMITEIREEERKLEGSTAKSDLRLALGLEPVAPSEEAKTSAKKKRSAVGKPSPKRRPVGDSVC